MAKPYSKESRDSVVWAAQHREEGVSIEKIAGGFGVHPTTVRKWIRQADNGVTPTQVNDGQVSDEQDEELAAISIDDPIRQGPAKVTEPPVEPQLELLPTDSMDWEDFERLLLDLGRHELGLRSLSYFGKRGQAQKGLDVVGTNAHGTAEGIQSKRYQQFTVADLNKTVDKYTPSTVPFTLVRLVIGVACRADDRAVVERKTALNEQHHPLEIDIWDQSRISEMLRDKPDIVIKYFGPRAAERFCVPHVLAPVEIAGPDAVATADAVLLGPLASTDAQALLDRANNISADDPAGALVLYRDIQSRLIAAGFPVHAAEFDNTVAALCVRRRGRHGNPSTNGRSLVGRECWQLTAGRPRGGHLARPCGLPCVWAEPKSSTSYSGSWRCVQDRRLRDRPFALASSRPHRLAYRSN